jgi:hypothetical protein
VSCCRRIEHLILGFKGAYRAVVLAEQIADGRPVSEEARQLWLRLPDQAFSTIDAYRQEKENRVLYHAANAAACSLGGIAETGPFDFPRGTLGDVAESCAYAAAHWQRRNDRDPMQERWTREELAAQMPLLHDIFGNPFRPVTIDPAWRTTTATQLARGMYDARDFAAMPILADALQDAGCEEVSILDHCRGRGPHVRGCWVVDLVLGKS